MTFIDILPALSFLFIIGTCFTIYLCVSTYNRRKVIEAYYKACVETNTKPEGLNGEE